MPKFRYKSVILSTALFLVGIVFLKIYKPDIIADDLGGPSFQQAIQIARLNIRDETAALLPHLPESVAQFFENFKCSATDSKEVIPSHFPEPLKEFMRYRHCRNFPVLLHPSPCEDDLYLLFVIKSMASQVERRAALRDTWGRAGRILGRRVKLVFLMGRSRDQVHENNVQPLVKWESNHYGDILQWDFEDIFYNLTLKEIGFLNWFSSSCSHTQFVFKGDDDVFVHTKNILKLLDEHKPETPMLTGYVFEIANVGRSTDSKYYIPEEIFSENHYPPFMSGGGYLMSRQTVLDLQKHCKNVTRFPLDDVFLGICLQQMGLKLTHHSRFETFGFTETKMFHDPCMYQDIMLVHQLMPDELRVMWALVHDENLICSKKN